MRKIAFVDLDDVLFFTKSFKKSYSNRLRLLSNMKVSNDQMNETYSNAKKDGFYDPDLHFKLLGEISQTSKRVFRECIEAFIFENAWQFVFSDVPSFFGFLKGHEYEIHILTLGTEWFQKAKIEGAGLLQHVSGYFVTQDPKKTTAILSLWDMSTADDILFFDDSKRSIEAAKLSFGQNIFAVQVLRRDEDLKKSVTIADAVVRNLEEATRAVLSRPR